MLRFSARALVAVFTAAITLSSLPSTALADDDENAPRLTASDHEGAIPPGYVPGLARAPKPEQYILKLSDDPVALEQSKAGRKLGASERNSIKSRLRAKQDSLDGAIAAQGGRILAKYQSAYNGIKVEISTDRVAALRALPGVVDVSLVERMERTNAQSVPFIKAPEAWSGPTGFRGEGVKIAVIDTGIDYTHATFGGAGTAEAYDAAFATSTAPADPAQFGPAAPKVKGGTDLVGDAYNGNNTPVPDPNPLDCNGHGSHVAGTAAGFGVTSSGATYAGPYDTSTHSTSFKVGPGVAPKADLYAVRVFGCTGSTRVTVDAIEWAVDNDMDVINMSLGSAFGAGNSSSAEAAHNATLAGVIVVASAGNSGPAQYITGAPASGTGVISVAAIDTVAPATFAMRKFVLNTGQSVVLRVNNDVALAPGSYDLVVLKKADGSVSLGCDEAEYADAVIATKIVVTHRGVCARVARAVFGDKHGAAAVVMIDNTTGYPPFEGQITGNPDTGEEHLVDISFLGAQGQSAPVFPGTANDAQKLAAATSAVVSEASPSPNPQFRAPSTFTSGGPRFGDSRLKPDVAAPGTAISSALVGSGSGNLTIGGTSMAAPHVAGVAALVRQAHPAWTVEAAKAAIVNTGDPTLFANSYRTSRVGTGVVRADHATDTSVYAVGDPGTGSLSFGFAEISSTFSQSKTATLFNTSSSAVTFNVSVARNCVNATCTGLSFSRPHTATVPSSVTVPANGSTTLSLGLIVTPAQAGSAAAYREVSGSVVLSPTGGGNSDITLRVPYLFVPRALSAVSTSVAGPWDPDTDASATLTNTGAIAGAGDFYAWGLEDGNEGLGSNDVRAVGVQSLPGSLVGLPNDRILVFAMNMNGRWNNPATNEYDVAIETGGDGKRSFILFAADRGLVTTGSFDGVLRSFIFNTLTGTITSSAFLPAATTDNGTVLIVVLASQVGLSADNSKFRYESATFAFRGIGDDFVHGKASFDAWTTNTTQGMFVNIPPGGSTTVTLTAGDGGITPNLGLMIVTVDNAAGASEAQLIKVPRD